MVVSADGIADAQADARRRLDKLLPALGIVRVDKAVTVWERDDQGNLESRFQDGGEVCCIGLPGGKAARLVVHDSFGDVGDWIALFDWVKSNGMTSTGSSWKVYDGIADGKAAITSLFVGIEPCAADGNTA
jgi:hypothetical protein